MSCSRSRSCSGPHEPLADAAKRASDLCHRTEELVKGTGHHEQCVINQLHRFDSWATSIGAYNSSPRALEARLREYSAWLPHETRMMLRDLETSLSSLTAYLAQMQQTSTPFAVRENLGELVSRTKRSIIHTIDDLYSVQHAIGPHDDDGGEPARPFNSGEIDGVATLRCSSAGHRDLEC
ncbi:hypothetical protein BJX76DRAFT_358140 [Aspergillus varians]